MENKYMWSESRLKTLRKCLYRYYLNYYKSWGGWYKNAEQDVKDAYRLKKLTNIPMYIGTIVHNMIDLVIKSVKNGKIMSLEFIKKKAINDFEKAWNQSVNQKWKENVTHNINFSEHYYKENISEEYVDDYKKKMIKCIEAFFNSRFYKLITSDLKPENFLPSEEYAAFKIKTGEEISVKIDFIYSNIGKIFIIDWKTGKISDNVINQLTTYAMYAMKQGWAKSPNDIVIIPVYLSCLANMEEEASPELTVTMEQMIRQATIIKDEYKLLINAHKQKENKDYFFNNRTSNEWLCKFCSFREICPGAIK